jgi:parallel beta-helix repeat protein
MGRGHGIYVPGSNNRIVYNDIGNATSNGIYSGGSGNLIDGNLVTSALSEALYVGSTTGTTVTERNLLKGSCVVLYSDLIKIKENKKVIQNCDYSDLSGSIWNLNYYVSLRNSAWVSIDSLTYENIDKSKGIYVYESNNISINSVRITSKERGSNDAISIENSEHISVSNSQFGDLDSGIYSYYNVYLDFESNTLTNCDYGITDVGSGDISIEGNTFRNSAFGIYLTNSVFFTVEDNELRNDRIREMLGFGVGIFISNSIHGSVVNNDISGFDLAGIIYSTVSYLETENNKIYDNGVGVDLYEISPRVYLKIHNNDIYDNQQYGVYSDSPVDARFNWWGDPSGPYQRCESQEGCEGNVNTEGEGNPVNSNVDASEPLYASGQGFTIVNSIQAIAYEYKFPIILILIVGIVAVVAWRRGWFEDWGDRTFAPSPSYYCNYSNN